MEFGEKQRQSDEASGAGSYLSDKPIGDVTSLSTSEAAEPATEKPKKRFSLRFTLPQGGSGVVKFLRKYWYAVIVVVLIIAGGIAWQAYNAQIDAKWSKATDYYSKADYAKAAKELEGLSQPTDEKRLQVYAQTMLATRKTDAALPAYAALYEKKKDPATKLIIGNIYNEQKKYDEAAKTYRELIGANGGYVQAYVNLATLNKLQGKSQDAIAVAKQGVAANPQNIVLHELLISMLLENRQSDDYKQAVATLKKLNPQDPIFDAIKE